MTRQELIDSEVQGLNKLAKDYAKHVQRVIEKIRKERVNLWLSKQDEYRLLTIRSWETKYLLSTQVILQILIPFWTNFVGRRKRESRRYNNNSQRLGIRIATLTGKKSEQILQDILKRSQSITPEHKSLYINKEREKIYNDYLIMLEKKRSKGFRVVSDPSSMYTENGSVKSLEDFATPEAFVKYYRKYIRKNQLAREECEVLFRQYAYRTNPFRPEYL